MKKSKTGAIALGVAFVWFTTHFGGGFASGAQIYSYFVRYGAWCILMPVLAMAYNGVFFAYSLRFARKHQTYDYRSYNNAFYGKYAPIFSNLFELLYLCVMCVAPAVAFATGGATLSQLTGLPYLLCTFLIGIFIFVVAIFGTDLVRRVASVLSICIIAGLLVVYLPNIAVNFSQIGAAVQQMGEEQLGVGPALYSAFLYGTFQLSNIAVFVQHAKSFEKPGDAVKSMGVGALVNALMMVMVVLGLMTIYTNPETASQSVPTLFMVGKRRGRLLYDAAYLPADYFGSGVHGREHGGRHGEACLRREPGPGAERGRWSPPACHAKGDLGRPDLLCGGFRHRPVWLAEPDPEGLQRHRLSGHSGHPHSVYRPYGRHSL